MNNPLKQPKKVNHLLAIFIAIQVVFIIIAIGVIIGQANTKDEIDRSFPSAQPHISIENFSSKIPYFPANKIDLAQNNLLDIVLANTPDVNLGEVKAIIRDDGVYEEYFGLVGISYTSAIIDIPELNQSYQVFLQSSSNDKNPYLDPNGSIIYLCLDDSTRVIYPDFSCTDIVSQKTRNALAAKYIEYFDFDGFSVSTGDYTNLTIVPLDFNNVDAELFIQETKDAISSLGISPDLFTYRIMQLEERDFLVLDN